MTTAGKMGISYSTARYLAPASFLFDFALQQYGIFSSPNMVDIHDQNISFFSPYPTFIGAFFFPQQLFQLAWLWRLWRADMKDEELDEVVDFVPFYALGNLCIGTWMFFWNSNHLAVANIFVTVNTGAQLFYLATRLKPMRTKSWPSILTHVVAKTFAGIGVLDLLHNTAAAYYVGDSPSIVTRVLTGVGFASLGAVSDWIFGGCLVYDLVALAVGQSIYRDDSWGIVLGAYAVGTAAIVGLRNSFMPPYQYQSLPGYDEQVDSSL